MAIRDRWNRMRSAATTSSASTSPSSPISSPVSAPPSPGILGALAGGFNWSSRSNTTRSSSTSSKASTDSADHQQQRAQQPPPQQQPTPPQQPRAKITFTLPARPSLKPTRGRRSRAHPADRQLTEENLAFQEVFAGYSLTSGSTYSSRCSLEGVSPCTSRRVSLDVPPA